VAALNLVTSGLSVVLSWFSGKNRNCPDLLARREKKSMLDEFGNKYRSVRLVLLASGKA